MLEFTQEQLDTFTSARETEFATLTWALLKEKYPTLWEKVAKEDEAGIAFIRAAQIDARKYFKGLEDKRNYKNHNPYDDWRRKYAEMAFLACPDFDQHPWTKIMLTEPLWHPYERVDILLGLLEMAARNENDRQFLAILEGEI